MSEKLLYRITNWPQYNQSLIQRGDLTLWLHDDVIESCKNPKPADSEGRGRPRLYPDLLVKAMLCIRYYYHLPLRATEGYFRSLMKIIGVENATIPSYATLSRRQKGIEVKLEPMGKIAPVHILVDSTGLKVFGEGEWKVRSHGKDGRRTWRKLHLALDKKSQLIYASELTENGVHDSQVMEDLLFNIEARIEKVTTDGAYDTMECRYVINEVDALATIPPRSNSVINPNPENDPVIELRNEAVKSVSINGMDAWKKQSGYHVRSLVETAMFRFKKLTGSDMRSRKMENQVVESLVRCCIVNRLTELGMPVSHFERK
jgi:hypothetical protein